MAKPLQPEPKFFLIDELYQRGVEYYSRTWFADARPGTKVFHAGTARAGEHIVTNGGRVLGVTALGHDLPAAQAAAYAAVDKIHFEGAHVRRDIAAKALPASLKG